ncbi:MAG: NAD(P)/FAD-dependent oxidoreductase [Betaproteobacteria bacterium]
MSASGPVERYDAVVIGAGAAGMMCAATAGARGRRVLLIEHYPKLGEKIRISGGGRCNFTNLHATPANFLSRNPDFCRSALARYTPRDFLDLVEQHGIAWHEKKLGQLFCDGSSLQIVAMLREECDRAGVQWRMPCAVTDVAHRDGEFVLGTAQGGVVAPALVVASGGLTVPKIGATPLGYYVAEQFGLAVVAPRPALVPLALDAADLASYGDLSGVSIDARVACNGGNFRENVLFTHRGLSGPAILQISSYWTGGDAIEIDLLPGIDFAATVRDARPGPARLEAVLAARWPRRFAQQWCEAEGALGLLAAWSERRIRELEARVHSWKLCPSGTLGYNKAEVTHGGVDTRELSSKTMAARRVPGLHFIGEVVDVTGHLGGFNFQWAWSSGRAAGLAI